MRYTEHLIDAAYSLTLRPYIFWHHHRTNKYGPAVVEKYGEVPARAGDMPCLLVHAVSVGEVVAAKTIIDEFTRRHPDWEIRISVSTATGRHVAAERYGAQRVVYYPLDLSRWVRRFFDRLRPTVLVLMELEVWPNFTREAARRGLPVIVANGRITEKSANAYARAGAIPLAGGLIRAMLNAPHRWLVQSQEYADRLHALGVTQGKVVVSGNVKYDTLPTHPDPAVRARYRQLLGAAPEAADAPVIVAGSTHPGEPSEEATVLAAFKTLRADFPGLKLVLVPRHPRRLEEVEKLAAADFPVQRRSALKPETPATAPVILVDTMGELANLYSAADAVFVGGTLIEHGGQNLMEPCGLGCPTITGPSLFNFTEAAQILREADGVRVIATRDDLLPALREVLQNHPAALAMAARGREALLARQGATMRVIDCLDQLLGGVSGHGAEHSV